MSGNIIMKDQITRMVTVMLMHCCMSHHLRAYELMAAKQWNDSMSEL
jgi:hypothetical protein